MPGTMAWGLLRQQEHNIGKPNSGDVAAVIVLALKLEMCFGAAESIVPTAAGM